MVAGRELPIDRFASDLELAETIFGDSVQIVSADYTGDRDSSGIYTNGNEIAPGVVPGDSGVLFSTGDLRGFTNNNPNESNLNTGTTTNSSGPNNVQDFNDAAGTNTFDASFLDVVFIPDGDVLTLELVFASEEYPEFTDSVFQDFVGIWVNGELVELSVGDGDVDPGNLNSTENGNLFQDNTNDQLNTEADGVTITLSLRAPVIAGEENTIRIGIADVADNNFDSTLLIAADSAQTALVANDDDLTIGQGQTRTFDILDNDTNSTGGTLSITQINGQPVGADGRVILPSGQEVQVNPDGSITIIAGPDEDVVNFTYQTQSSTGETSTAFVTLNTVPCFVEGTMILTDRGEIPIEALEVGDKIITKDEGPQPLRWIGQRRVEATGDFAPIRIRANTFGTHGDLSLSPLHRVLIRDCLTELLFGEPEVLVAARDLINGSSVQRVEGGEVTYFHLLFDRHQVIYSAGLETESFLPGPQIKHSFEQEMIHEICTLFPELEPDTGEGYSKAARRMLKRYEGQLLSLKWAA